MKSFSQQRSRRAMVGGAVGAAGLGLVSALGLPGRAAPATPARETGDTRTSPIGRVIERCLIKLGAILEHTALEEFGLAIDGERVATLHVGLFALTTAPTAELFRIDPIAYSEGVDVAFLHVKLPPASEPDTPTGFYNVRAIAPITGVGVVEGTLQLVDARGAVVLEDAATFDTFSPTVPPNAEDFTLITTELAALEQERTGVGMSEWCSNGTHWISGCDIWDFMGNGVY